MILIRSIIKYDKLVTSDKEANIDKIEIKSLDKPVKVYNFEVEDWHNYFVGKNRALVHNDCDVTKLDYNLIKNYIRDIENRTGFNIPKNQIEELKNALRNKEYTKLNSKETAKYRN